jgi:hypothetical protein
MERQMDQIMDSTENFDFEAEIKKLRARVRELEETQRWRKWPEDDPTETECQYLVVDKQGRFSVNYWGQDGDGSGCWNEYVEYGSHWRPIGPLPGGES